MLAFRNNYSLLGWKGRLAAVGINHQSNGRADPLSRSWNRVMFNDRTRPRQLGADAAAVDRGSPTATRTTTLTSRTTSAAAT